MESTAPLSPRSPDAPAEPTQDIEARRIGKEGGATLARCGLRGCRLDGIRGAERLRGARMPWPDVVGATAVLAGALGIEIVD